MLQKIKSLAKQYAPEFIEVRHHLHAHPELSYQEFETSKFVQGKLKEFGIPFEIKATTGVIGLIEGKNPGKRIIALRADMDALPIKEENDIVYKSKNEGVMHACGHDVHTTCLLGASKILNELKNEWEGTVETDLSAGRRKKSGRCQPADQRRRIGKPRTFFDFWFTCSSRPEHWQNELSSRQSNGQR